MSNLRKKIGQLMVFGFHGKTPSKEINELIRLYNIGGIILFGRNIGTPEEVLKLNTDLQQEARQSEHEQPLLICIDQENGVVRRLGDGTTMFPGAMLLGATKNPENAYKIGVATGKELKALGINWNLAPVVDVNNNPLNPVIGVRSYGEDVDLVSDFAKASIKGIQEAGVITTLKHFPGHGDTDIDSHLNLPTILHDMDRLEKIELKPFKECIEFGSDTVMSAHVHFKAIVGDNPIPATLSKDVITGLLREKLGFNGVVTTDCMEMKAISNTIGTARGAVEAIKAGIDLIMVSHSYDLQKDSIEAIAKAVENGEIEESIIDEAIERVYRLKEKYLLWEDSVIEKTDIELNPIVGCLEHEKEASEVFRQGITICKNHNNIIPLSNEVSHKVLVVYPTNTKLLGVEDELYADYSLGSAMLEVHPSAKSEIVSNPLTEKEVKGVLKKAESFDTIILGTMTITKNSKQIKLIETLLEMEKKVVVIAMRSPYDLAYLPNVPAYVATYEFSTSALKMVAKAIYGMEEVTGTLPVTIPNLKMYNSHEK